MVGDSERSQPLGEAREGLLPVGGWVGEVANEGVGLVVGAEGGVDGRHAATMEMSSPIARARRVCSLKRSQTCES